VSLARLIETSCELIPPESNAKVVVQSIFLPYIASHEAERNVVNNILKTLKILLKNRKHASAMIGPLVRSVSANGNEILETNPVRQALFDALQREIEVSCDTLVSALQAAKSIDGNSRHSDALDINLQKVQLFIHCSLKKPEQKLPGLRLLLALLQRHPSTAPSLVKLLILEDMHSLHKKLHCMKCGFRGSCNFLNLFHSAGPHASSITISFALRCLGDLLHALPLNIWLKRDKRSAKVQSTTFQNQLMCALEAIICAAICVKIDEQTVESFSYMLTIVLKKIPFEFIDTDIGSSLLVDKLVLYIFDNRQEVKHQKIMANVFIECLGGQWTPQGQLTCMSIPVKHWLNGEKENELANHLLDSAKEDSIFATDSSLQLLKAIIRVQPYFILCNEARWYRFRSIVQSLLNNVTNQIEGVQLIKSLLRGRKDYYASELLLTGELQAFFMPSLEMSLLHGNVSTKCITCSAYGFLLPSDWMTLFSREPSLSARHVRNILFLCTSQPSSLKLRSESCKAVGDVCSAMIQGIDDATVLDYVLLKEVLHVMLQASNDFSGNVRSMALFTVGNLFQSLFSVNNVSNGLDEQGLFAVAEKCLDLIQSDIDEKVACNAIRSVGHALNLMLRDDYREMFNQSTFYVADFLHRVIQALVSVIDLALMLELESDFKRQMTWKQRSGTKKKGRGACNSLVILLKSNLLKEIQFQQLLPEPFECLIRCIRHVSIINEKLALSASAALRAIDVPTLSRLFGSSDDRLGVLALASCCNFLFSDNDKVAMTKTKTELQSLLLHLLGSVKTADAVFLVQTLSMDELVELYQCMVDSGVPAHVFGCFALAFQTISSSLVDVDVEQRFFTQAVRLDECEEEL
jgi:hypothetical protein